MHPVVQYDGCCLPSLSLCACMCVCACVCMYACVCVCEWSRLSVGALLLFSLHILQEIDAIAGHIQTLLLTIYNNVLVLICERVYVSMCVCGRGGCLCVWVKGSRPLQQRLRRKTQPSPHAPQASSCRAIYLYIYVYMNIYIYIYIFTYTYIYIYMYTQMLLRLPAVVLYIYIYLYT